MIVTLFAVALAVGLLVGLGAHQISRHWQERPAQPQIGEPLSTAAASLGYKTEYDYRTDTERSALATHDVLLARAGAQRLWENAESGNRGVVWASSETQQQDGRTCRDVERRTVINNVYASAIATICKRPRGAWEDAVTWRPN